MCNSQQMLNVLNKHGFINVRAYEEKRHGYHHIVVSGDCPCGDTSSFAVRFTTCEPHEDTDFERMVIAHKEKDIREGRWI